jgi:hypothetical protein
MDGEIVLKRFLPIIITCVLLLPSYVYAAPEDETDVKKLTERLNRLEPKEPLDMPDPPFFQGPFPSNIKSPQTIIQSGSQLPYITLLDKPDWKRPAYKTYWHSSVSGGRWSYVPNRIHFAEHRLFTDLTAALSEYYDFIHDIGLEQEMISISTEPKNANQTIRLNQVIVVIMKAKVEKVLTKGNQVVIIARPQRFGVQAFTVNRLNMNLDNPKEFVLFQLVTPEGDEIDYSVN